MAVIMQGRAVVAGAAQGDLLVSGEALSLWGGYDARSGEIIDRRHPLSGQVASGKILALPASRGSSTTTAVLLEAVRSGSAPAALITRGVDSFFALASLVAEELYGSGLPVVALTAEDFDKLPLAGKAVIDMDGTIEIEGAG